MDAPAIRRGLMVSGLMLAEFASGLEIIMVYTAMPTLTRTFGSAADVGWVITACLLVSAASAALCGRLGDLFGRRRVLLAVLAIAWGGSLISAISGQLGGVIVGTSLQGVAGAVTPLCIALLRERLPARKVPFSVGVLMAAVTGAAAGGLVIGGAMVDAFGWASVFWTSASVTALAWLAVFFGISTDPSRGPSAAGQIDMVRGVLFAPALAGILLTLTRGGDWGLTDPRTIALGIASFGTAAYWVRHQLREARPLIDLRLLANRQVGLTALCMFFLALGVAQHSLLMMMFLQQPTATLAGFGMTAAAAGAALMPVRLAGIPASAISGRICGLYGARAALILGVSVALTGWVLIAVFHTSFPMVMVGMLLEGVGFLMAYVGIPNAMIGAVPESRTGEATGMSQVMRMAGTAVGAQIVMQLISVAQVSGPGGTKPHPSDWGYQLAFGYIIAMTLLCGLAAFLLPRRDDIVMVSAHRTGPGH